MPAPSPGPPRAAAPVAVSAVAAKGVQFRQTLSDRVGATCNEQTARGLGARLFNRSVP